MKTTLNKVRKNRKSIKKNILSYYEIYLLLIPVIVYFLIFHYYPMYGLQIAFRDYKVSKGIWGSEWVGIKHFVRFFSSPVCATLIKNTLRISVYSLLAGFAPPIILALLFNYQKCVPLKKIVQSLSFAPHFISMVALVGMLKLFTGLNTGVFNHILDAVGLERINFFASPSAFPHLYVWSGIWQNVGWSAIIYIGALSAVDPTLHEAAIVDGATLLQRIWHIDLPGIANVIVVQLVLNAGNILNIGFEKVYLMLNDLNSGTAEMISTYVYKQGILGGQFSYTTAIGMFNSIINLLVLVLVNKAARSFRGTSVF